MLTTAERDAILNIYDTDYYVGWLSAIADWRGGTETELSYDGYERALVSFGAPADTSPVGGRQKANDVAATGGQKTDAGSVSAIGWALYSVESGGDPSWIGMLDADEPFFGTVDLASPGVIQAFAHGLEVNQRVFALAAPGAITPTGISENTAYFVGTAPDADSLTLSTTTANANPVNTSGAGALLFCPYTALSIAQNATPEFAIGALIIQI